MIGPSNCYRKPNTRSNTDPVARQRNVKTIEEFAKFVESWPNRENKPFLLDKGYLLWILGRYAQGGIGSISDISQAWTNLETFHKGKSRLAAGQRDLNRYKKLSDLDRLVIEMRTAGATQSKKAAKMETRKAELDRLIKNKSIKPVFEDGKIQVYQLKKASGAKFLGQGTRWCTSMLGDEGDRYFHEYTADNHKLYAIFFKGKSEKLSFENNKGEIITGVFPVRYQILFEDFEYKNAADDQTEPKEIAKLAPGSLGRAFRKRAEFNPNLSESDALKEVTARPSVLKYLKAPSDEVIATAVKHGGADILSKIDSKRISPQLQLRIVKDNPENIQHIKNPDVDAAKVALDSDPQLAMAITPLTEELARYACSLDRSMGDYCNFFLEDEIEDWD